jgi:hypothetical protein
VISKEDEDYHSERNNVTKIMRLLKLSTYKREQMERLSKQDKNIIINNALPLEGDGYNVRNMDELNN